MLTTGVLRDIPAPQEGEYEEEFMPSPCTVSPTPVVEYPNWNLPQELRQTLQPRIEELEELEEPVCTRGHRMEHLLSVTPEEDLDIFLCRQCPELPYAHRYDCVIAGCVRVPPVPGPYRLRR
ncbi:hypothetical protein ACWKT5_16750 [Streptomyces avermitilis]